MEKYYCCTTCPLECKLTVSVNECGVFQAVAGNRCPRGENFARQELVLPLRVLTSTVRIAGARDMALLPVRSNCAFALNKHHQAMEELQNVSCRAPVRMGEAIAADIAGTNAVMIASCDAD